MFQLLWLIPTLPLAGFLALAIAGRYWPRAVVAFVGVGTVAASALLAILIGIRFGSSPPAGYAWSQTLWTWINVAGFTPGVSFYLDALSVVMILVVTCVGFLIHLYSAEFMKDDGEYNLFFAYMNLFVSSMLVLVMADNLLLLYLGWEGVGLCSYLLIGFWYKDPNNGLAARKAFIVTRVGDTALAIGLFLLFFHLGTLNIQELMLRAQHQWPVGSALPTAAAILLLGGAVGKSAQLPLQTWLPDAMAGPTPVSALIHAATMVTAGVYLIARTHVLFSLAPAIQLLVAIIGAVTLLISGFSALTQRDIKRVLAYSTISQIGYKFLALGVGAWSAAIFHFMTHAFFKSLLFLGAGVIIIRLEHEHDMFKMGGLRKYLPTTFWCFLIAAGSLSAVPLVTAGFYSKDLILWHAWSSPQGGTLLWIAGLVGAFLTSVYTFRMVFLTFFGEPQPFVRQNLPLARANALMAVPLIVLAVLSVIGGFVQTPPSMGNIGWFDRFLRTALPPSVVTVDRVGTEETFDVISGAVSLIGIYFAWLLFMKRRPFVTEQWPPGIADALHRFWFVGWGFDRLYDLLFVRPVVWFARVDSRDFVDLIFEEMAAVSRASHTLLSFSQNGRLRWYAMGISIGAVLAVAVVLL